MKIHHTSMIMGWRISIGIGIGFVVGFAVFSFLRYQEIVAITHSPVTPSEQERSAMFSPVLLDDIKAFWEQRGGRTHTPLQE